MTSQTDNTTLPEGWVQQYDEGSQHPFWVDTNVNPPRSIWVHPYEDDQFLNEHPDIKARMQKQKQKQKQGQSEQPSDQPPPYSPRRHSYSGPSGSDSNRIDGHGSSDSRLPTAGTSSNGQGSKKQRGFFGKLKDKAIGTKEEREEAKRQHALYMQQLAEQRRQQRMSAPYGYPGAGRYQQSMYGPPAGSPYGSGYGYGRGPGYGSMGGMGGMGGRRGGGFGGIGLPLIGGLAGGLLLGEALDGWGDGGFDGGFDGGGFDGGGFDGGFD